MKAELFWSCRCGEWAIYPSPERFLPLRILEILRFKLDARRDGHRGRSCTGHWPEDGM